MSGNSPEDRASRVEEVGGASAALQAYPWLLRQKITIPDPVPGYAHRPELVERAMPIHRRLTVLKAPGGFGKTTLLAECCRELRQDGIAVAWVSLDERDEPGVLEMYLAFACAGAGLTFGSSKGKEAVDGSESRIGAVVRGVELFGRPLVIALDEVERLRHPASAELVSMLLQQGPPNLHLAIACRDIPDGLDLASTLLEGRAEVLEAEDLRFSAAETARFFDLRLSPRALEEEMIRSAGWAFALRISLINMERGARGSRTVASDFVENWIESRLFADLARDERDFVLDLGLFDWVDAALLDEALQRADSMRRVESLTGLAGLIEQVGDGEARVWRLHPLMREHCAKQRTLEDPERSGAIHRRIADVLARRGETVLAMRHAVAGGDPFLAGGILERTGGVRLWIHQGVPQLQAAHRLLSEDVISESPRLMLLSSAALALSGRTQEARTLYRKCADGDRGSSGTNAEWAAEDCIVRGCIASYAGEPIGSGWMDAFSRDMARLERLPHIDALTRGYLEYAHAVLHFMTADFDRTLERLSSASELLAGTQYLAFYAEIVRGQVEFIRGRPLSAESHFRRSQRIARRHLPLDPVAALSSKVVMKEMGLECSPLPPPAEPPSLRRALLSAGVPFSFFATAINLMIDLRLQSGRISQALVVANEVLGHLRRVGSISFERLVVALRISLLVRMGRLEDADRAYRQQALPEDPARCVDLGAQTWREVEAVSEARVRLLTAHGRFGDARSLLRKWRSVAVERRLRRMEMRTLALSIMMEQQAGETDASLRSLEEYLRIFAESPFAWSLVREWTTCAEAVKKFLELHPESPHREAARSLLAAMRRMDDGSNLALSDREREVLSLLPGRQVKNVAATLGLSVHGVRFHLRKLFTKLRVSNRTELLQQATELGLIANDS